MEGVMELISSLPGLGAVGGIIAAIFLLWRRSGQKTTEDVISRRSLEMLEEKQDEAMAEAEVHIDRADDLRDRRESLEDDGPAPPVERTEQDRLDELDARLRAKIDRADDPH